MLCRKPKKVEIEVKIGSATNVVDPFADDPMEEPPATAAPPVADGAAAASGEAVTGDGAGTAGGAASGGDAGTIVGAKPNDALTVENAELSKSRSLDALDAAKNEALVPDAAIAPTDGATAGAVVASAPPPESPSKPNLVASLSEKAFKRKNRKMKFVLKPLPIVPCVVFTGFAGKMKQNLALTQAFTSLFKMITQNYGNREVAFRMGLLEEICDVALVCQGIPRVLEYVIWIVNCMYSEGFGEEEEADDNVLVNNANDDYSMILSISITSGTAAPAAAGQGMAAVQFLKSQPVGTILSSTDDGRSVVSSGSPPQQQLQQQPLQFMASTGGIAFDTAGPHTLLLPHMPTANIGMGAPQNLAVVPASGALVASTNNDAESIHSHTNLIIDTISEMSVPTVDEDGDYSEATPEVNLGDPNIDYVEVERKLAEEAELKAAIARREKEKQREALANAARGRPLTDEEMRANAQKQKEQQESAAAALLVRQESEAALLGEGTNAMAALEDKDVTNIAVVGNDFNDKKRKKPSLMKQKPPNGQVVKQIGQAEYEARYVQRPKDAVILACALIANHNELNLREKQMATRWLDTWDDCSRDYKLLKKKGADLSSI